MAIIGTIKSNCGAKEVPQTGIGNCLKKEGKTVALFLTALNAAYPVDGEEFNSNLTGANGYVNIEGVQRILPITNIINNTPSGGDIATSEVGFGGPIPIGYNAYSEVYQIDAGDCLFKQLVKLNKQKMRVFRVDDEESIYGTAKLINKDVKLIGFDAYIMVQRVKADGTNPYALNLGVYYSVNYEKEIENLHSFVLDEIPDGLIGVTLKKGTTPLTAEIVSVCDGDNSYTAQYGAEWLPAMFVNSAGVEPTSVTYSTSTKMLTFAPAGSYRIKSASALIAGNIEGLDGVDRFIDLT